MAYDIYSKDVLHDSDDSSSSQKKSSSGSPSKVPFDISNGLIVNIALILLLLIIIGVFYFGDFSLKDEVEVDEIILTGDLVSFNKNITGEINIYAGEYELILNTGTFSGNNENFKLEDFNGTIKYVNKSFILLGTVDLVEFGRNKLNVKHLPIELRIKNKLKFDSFFDKLELDFNEGRIKVNEDLNLKLTDSNIIFYDVNLNLNYDGKFSINSNAKSFVLENKAPNFTIIYEE